MTTFTATLGVDFDFLDLSPLAGAQVVATSANAVSLVVGGISVHLTGSGFQTTGLGPPGGGDISGILVTNNGMTAYEISGLALPAATFRSLIQSGDNAGVLSTMFGGGDSMTGSSQTDLVRGFAGDDTIMAGEGNDFIGDTGGSNYLRGDGGDDDLRGGSAFDDLNGNMGNDTVAGGLGNDWVLGGKDNDLLFGDDGNDIVYGNLGDDICQGGAGNDIIRGGQQNDSISGGAGNDFVSGDRGDDTIAGDAGADIFHSSNDAGIDRVLDFSVSQGDRIQLDPGSTYTVAQVGADTIITLPAAQMILVGVSMSSLTANSIFLA
jgi:serralysin